MQAMKGATVALGSMNKSMNLPQLQRIAMEFERENDIMDQRQEMMDDAIDDAMDVGVEEEGDEVVEQVLEEIGVDLNQSVSIIKNLLRWDVLSNVSNTSSGRHRRAYRQAPCLKAGWHKQSPVVAAILVTMISRLAWTACGDDAYSYSQRPLGVTGSGPEVVTSYDVWSYGRFLREASVFIAIYQLMSMTLVVMTGPFEIFDEGFWCTDLESNAQVPCKMLLYRRAQR